MKYPYDSVVHTGYGVDVEVNGVNLAFTGAGRGLADTGEVSVEVATNGKPPEGFHPALLAFCLLTGQADMGPCLMGARNPLRYTYGAYSAERTLVLDRGLGTLQASYDFGPMENGRRDARFRIAGTTRVPKLVAIRPAFESWVPDGPGKMRGHFTMIWVAEDGSYIKGETDTHYAMPGSVLEAPLYRRIQFALDANESRLRQEERIVIFPEDATFVAAA